MLKIKGLFKRHRVNGEYEWHIDKCVKRYGRLCESTGTADREEAERYLLHRLKELREIRIYGERPTRTFREAASKYLMDVRGKKSIARDEATLRDLDRFIGHLPLDRINNDSFQKFRRAQRHLSTRTRNQKVALARRILWLAAQVWCFEGTNLTWLRQAPEILLEKGHQGRKPYPLDEREQTLLFSELRPAVQQAARFAVNTGARDQELCRLEWKWERRLPVMDGEMSSRSVFVLPAEIVKGGVSRVLVLNDDAQAIVDARRGRHRRFVFLSVTRHRPLRHLRDAGWNSARRRAADRYRELFGIDAPAGFRNVRVHDLRHTFGRKLRAAGVGLEDRRDLLGHRAPDVTTHYSVAEIGNLVAAANRIVGSRGNSTPTLLSV